MGDEHRDEEAAYERLRLRLKAAGTPDAEIEQADAQGQLLVLAIRRLVLGAVPMYTRAQVADAVGVPRDVSNRLWRAFGFADVAEDEVAFTDRDIDALRTVLRYVERDVTNAPALTQLARVVGSSMARVAEANIDVMRERFDEAGVSNIEAVELILNVYTELRNDWDRLFGYAFSRHLQAALARSPFVHGTEGDHSLAVGFADLVAFTVLSQELEERELLHVVDSFETLSYDTIATYGGRVVKMIGDEVMFVADDPVSAAHIGLELAEAYRDDEMLTDVRVGVAYGPVLAREGDYFGTVVNLASRLVNIAYAGTVVVSEPIYELLKEDPGFGWKPIRPHRLKGFGFTSIWAVTRPDEGRPVMTSVATKVRARRNRGSRSRRSAEPESGDAVGTE